MKLQLIIDGIYHEIDSTNPDLLAHWIVEIFGRIEQITPATLIEFRSQPSWVPTGNPGAPWAPDWAADSRVIGQILPARTPRELLTALGKQLDELEALHASDRAADAAV